MPHEGRRTKGTGMSDSEKVTALRDALIAGEESGDPLSFDNTAFLKRMRDKYVADEGHTELRAEIDKGLVSPESHQTIEDVIARGPKRYC